MPIELNREARSQAIASIERYFAEELDQRIGNIAAGALLSFFLEEIGPLVYNQTVSQVQEHLQERIQELDIEFKGSLEALSSFAAGHADLAGFHIPLGSHPGALAPFQRWLKPRQHRLIGFIEREQGLMLPPGNPAHVRGLGDLAGNKLRVVNRQRGSGTRLLFDQLLKESGIDGHALRGYSTEEFTHLAVAATIAAGKADAGFGVKAAALQYGLAFKLLERERYLLACRSEAAKEPTIRRLREAIASPAMLRVIRSLPGYADANSGSLLSFTRGFAGSSKAKRN